MNFLYQVFNHQEEKCDRLTTNTEDMEENEPYEEVSGCADSTFNMEHNISYATSHCS